MGSGHVHPAPLTGSFIGRLDARAKVLAFVPAVIFVNLLPFDRPAPVVAVALLFASIFALCGRGAWLTLRRAVYFLPFVIFVVATLPFAVEGRPVWTLDLGLFKLVASAEGLLRAAAVALRAGASIMGVLLLSGATEAPDLFKALRALYVPKAFVAIISIIYRYLFEIADEFSSLRRAAAARGFEARNFTAVPKMAAMASAMLTRSVARSERVHHAMLSRGYDGELRTLSTTAFTSRDAAFLAVFYCLLTALVFLALHA